MFNLPLFDHYKQAAVLSTCPLNAAIVLMFSENNIGSQQLQCLKIKD